MKVKLPEIAYWDLFSKANRDLSSRSIDFSSRPTAEPLLRKTINELIQCGYIDLDKSIIDIGCFIADNSIVWAKFLKKGGVYAIDPSQENLNFGIKIAKLNGIDNINWVKAVCYDKSNILLAIKEGDIEHAVFGRLKNRRSTEYSSRTLDEIIPSALHDKISLVHIDVEGLEWKVILGTQSIIEKSNPILVFEQHISNENPLKIITFLKSHYYEVFMINEVLPGCEKDCRNFIAFSKLKSLPKLPKVILHQGRSEGIYFASYGDWLIKV